MQANAGCDTAVREVYKDVHSPIFLGLTAIFWKLDSAVRKGSARLPDSIVWVHANVVLMDYPHMGVLG